MAIKKLERDFLWEGGKQKKDRLVKWDVVKHKEKWGLGLGRLKERNLAMLGN